MSRSGYTEDLDEAVLNLWRGAVRSAIRGERGQALLRDLRAALDAMPEKKLVYGTLRDEATGQVCALGAVGVKRGLTMPEITDEDYGKSNPALGKLFNIAPALAAEVQYVNDEVQTYDADFRLVADTDELRYERVSQWVNENLNGANR